jgi:hypothetical protein
MAATDRLFGLAGSKSAEASELIPGATELKHALFDGRLLAFRRGQEGSWTWIPAPRAFELADPDAFTAAAMSEADRSRKARGLPSG